MARVLIGAAGFKHHGWDESYYPPDIPEDWKLAFYANDFTAILLPEYVWRKADQDEMEDWLEDIDEGFRVYLRVSTKMPEINELKNATEVFRSHLAGFFVDENVQLDADKLFSDKAFPDKNFPDNYLPADVNQSQPKPDLIWLLSGKHRSKAENSSITFWGVLEDIDHTVNAVVVNLEMDKRKLKEAFEKIESYLDTNRDVLVLYDVPSPVVQDLKDLRILLELMGIA